MDKHKIPDDFLLDKASLRTVKAGLSGLGKLSSLETQLIEDSKQKIDLARRKSILWGVSLTFILLIGTAISFYSVVRSGDRLKLNALSESLKSGDLVGAGVESRNISFLSSKAVINEYSGLLDSFLLYFSIRGLDEVYPIVVDRNFAEEEKAEFMEKAAALYAFAGDIKSAKAASQYFSADEVGCNLEKYAVGGGRSWIENNISEAVIESTLKIYLPEMVFVEEAGGALAKTEITVSQYLANLNGSDVAPPLNKSEKWWTLRPSNGIEYDPKRGWHLNDNSLINYPAIMDFPRASLVAIFFNAQIPSAEKWKQFFGELTAEVNRNGDKTAVGMGWKNNHGIYDMVGSLDEWTSTQCTGALEGETYRVLLGDNYNRRRQLDTLSILCRNEGFIRTAGTRISL